MLHSGHKLSKYDLCNFLIHLSSGLDPWSEIPSMAQFRRDEQFRWNVDHLLTFVIIITNVVTSRVTTNGLVKIWMIFVKIYEKSYKCWWFSEIILNKSCILLKWAAKYNGHNFKETFQLRNITLFIIYTPFYEVCHS